VVLSLVVHLLGRLLRTISQKSSGTCSLSFESLIKWNETGGGTVDLKRACISGSRKLFQHGLTGKRGKAKRPKLGVRNDQHPKRRRFRVPEGARLLKKKEVDGLGTGEGKPILVGEKS